MIYPPVLTLPIKRPSTGPRLERARVTCPIALVGPTAVGKTVVAVELAGRLSGEIVNADSMQVYRGMDIGTAKPTREDQARARFHLLDIAAPDEPSNVARWRAAALRAIAGVKRRGMVPIISGGTGLYVRSLLDGWMLASAPPDLRVRNQLRHSLALYGSAAMHERLRLVDPEAAERLHPNDSVRIVRALEVLHTTGETLAQRNAPDRSNYKKMRSVRIGLTAPRGELYRRIDARVNDMFAAGLVEEVRRLVSEGYGRTLGPLNSLGYKEVVAHLFDGVGLEETIAAVKQNTRRYAKRQLTWFRADREINWFDVSAHKPDEVAWNVADHILRVAG